MCFPFHLETMLLLSKGCDTFLHLGAFQFAPFFCGVFFRSAFMRQGGRRFDGWEFRSKDHHLKNCQRMFEGRGALEFLCRPFAFKFFRTDGIANPATVKVSSVISPAFSLTPLMCVSFVEYSIAPRSIAVGSPAFQ